MTALVTAAKAMYVRNAAAASGRLPWDKATDSVKSHMIELARSAFESVREPTEAMKLAVREAGGVQSLAYALAAWPTMITTILEEKV